MRSRVACASALCGLAPQVDGKKFNPTSNLTEFDVPRSVPTVSLSTVTRFALSSGHVMNTTGQENTIFTRAPMASMLQAGASFASLRGGVASNLPGTRARVPALLRPTRSAIPRAAPRAVHLGAVPRASPGRGPVFIVRHLIPYNGHLTPPMLGTL